MHRHSLFNRLLLDKFMPEVSIIIATHNNEKTIGKSIKSAQNQTVRDIEIVVVDDGSTDGTYDLIAAMAASDARIKCVRQRQNIGPGGARNAALANATGEWIAILDADDWYDPTRLEVLLKAAQDYKADLVADNLKIYDHVRQQIILQTNYGKKNQVAPLTAKTFFDVDNPLQRHPMGFIKPLIRRKFLAEHKIVYDQAHRVGEDFLFVGEILLQGARAFVVPGAYYIYVNAISSTTRKKSPHSHSNVASTFSFIVRGCNELLQKYGATMSSEEHHALLRRRWLFERAVMYKDMRAALDQGQFFKATRICITQPVVLLIIGNVIIGLLAANARRLRLASIRMRIARPVEAGRRHIATSPPKKSG
jgi:succinoglycan biosynthesis protein ExoO